MAAQTMILEDGELAKLMRELPTGTHIMTGFGPAGVWLKWDDAQPMPLAVRRLRLMRGIDNENTEGAGI